MTYSPSSGGELTVLNSLPAAIRTLSWEEAVDAYLLTAIDSENTRRAYLRHLCNAGAALAWSAPADISGEELAHFRAALLAAPLAHASKAQALSAVRAFFTWGRMMGIHTLASDLVEMVLKTPRGSTQSKFTVVTDREIVSLIGATGSARDRAILGLLLGAGLRVAECAALDVTDLREEQEGGMLIFVHEGQGRKDRMIPVRADVESLLRSYLAETKRYLGTEGPMFLAEDAGVRTRGSARLSARSVALIVKGCAAAAQITAKRVSPHALRHTYAVRCLRAGGNVVAVSKLLGHVSIATTQRYVDHLALSELRSAVPDLPLAG